MRLSRFLAAMLLAVVSLPAVAHETTRSYLALERNGAAVTAELRLAFRDIEVVVWMDQDLDGRITWGEARKRLDAAGSYAAARVTVDAGGPCPMRPTGAAVSRSADVDYLDLTFTATCPDATATLQVGSTLFSEIDPSHRMFLTLSEAGRAASAVIGAADGPRTILPEDGAIGAFASYFRAGAEHLLAGPDHIVFLLVLLLPAIGGRGTVRSRLLGIITAVTGFTIAHALTLTAATTAILRPPAALIEVLIALSILLTAIDNVRPFIPGPRAALAGFFGTIHGFGFATALAGLSLGGGGFVVAMLGFNLGIEAAQVGIVVLAMPALTILGNGRWTLWIGSVAAGAVALIWLWERVPALAGLT